MHDRGISREGDLLDLGIEEKVIDKSGAWINYGEMRLGQGRENAKQFLRDNPALVDEITKKVMEKKRPATPEKPNAETNGKPEEPTPAPTPTGRRGKQAAAAAE